MRSNITRLDNGLARPATGGS